MNLRARGSTTWSPPSSDSGSLVNRTNAVPDSRGGCKPSVAANNPRPGRVPRTAGLTALFCGRNKTWMTDLGGSIGLLAEDQEQG